VLLHVQDILNPLLFWVGTALLPLKGGESAEGNTVKRVEEKGGQGGATACSLQLGTPPS